MGVGGSNVNVHFDPPLKRWITAWNMGKFDIFIAKSLHLSSANETHNNLLDDLLLFTA